MLANSISNTTSSNIIEYFYNSSVIKNCVDYLKVDPYLINLTQPEDADLETRFQRVLRNALQSQVGLSATVPALSILFPVSTPTLLIAGCSLIAGTCLLTLAQAANYHAIKRLRSAITTINNPSHNRLTTLEFGKLRSDLKALKKNNRAAYKKIKPQIFEAINKNHLFKIVKACKDPCTLNHYRTYWGLSESATRKDLEKKIEESYRPEYESLLEYFEKDPYIHGTNSAIFSLLPSTEQKFLSVPSMLANNMAPMSGELFCGGLSTAKADGQTSFSKLNDRSYGFNRCVKDYTQHKWEMHDFELNKVIKNYKMDTYSLLELLVLLVRERQAGSPILKTNDRKTIETLVEALKENESKIKTRLLWISFILQFIHPQTYQGCVSVYNLINKPDFPEEFKQALKNPKQVKADSAAWLEMLNLEPHLYEISSPASFLENIDRKDVVLDGQTHEISQYLITQINYTLTSRLDFRLIEKSILQKRSMPSRFINVLLPFYMDHIQSYSQLISKLTQQCCDILYDDSAVLKLPTESMQYVKNAVPLVVFSQNHELMEWIGGEYRSARPLKLGHEITLLACERKDRALVEGYLTKYSIQGITIVDIDFIKRFTYHN